MRKPSGPEAGFTGLSGLFWTIALFSTVVNVLMLTAPLYMLQVYDRVIPSRSHETLLALTILVAALFVDHGHPRLRARPASRRGSAPRSRRGSTRGCSAPACGARCCRASARRPASGLKDLEAVQRLAGSPVLFAVFDMPWAPIFIIAIYSFHPLPRPPGAGGHAAPDRRHRPEPDAHPQARDRGDRRPRCRATPSPRPIRQQSEMIQALGMQGAVLDRWQTLRGRAIDAQLASGDRVSQFSIADQDLPLLPAVGDARPRRLHRAPRRDERRRDDRGLDPARPRAGAGRAGDRRLAAGAARAARLGEPQGAARDHARAGATPTALPRPRARTSRSAS